MTQDFERQVGNLIAKGYPSLAGLTEESFAGLLEPLRSLLPDADSDAGLPFVIVVKREVVLPELAMEHVSLGGKPGFVEITGAQPLEHFRPIDGVHIPGAAAYLLLEVDLGAATLNVTPDDALLSIRTAGRSPLTVEEGVAVVTHFPEVLTTHNAFSMLASRSGDRRVTAIWLSGGRPRLGWCWAGNPHTWLGSASCRARAG